MTATYARCTEPTEHEYDLDGERTASLVSGCGWTGELERVRPVGREEMGFSGYLIVAPGIEVTHDGEGRWPFDIDKCPACGGTIEVDK